MKHRPIKGQITKQHIAHHSTSSNRIPGTIFCPVVTASEPRKKSAPRSLIFLLISIAYYIILPFCLIVLILLSNALILSYTRGFPSSFVILPTKKHLRFFSSALQIMQACNKTILFPLIPRVILFDVLIPILHQLLVGFAPLRIVLILRADIFNDGFFSILIHKITDKGRRCFI